MGGVLRAAVSLFPLNKENEARGTVVRENVKFDRKFNFLEIMEIRNTKD